MSDKEQTAVDWVYEKIKSHFEHDGDLLESINFTIAIAKEKEREQHGNTWDAALALVRTSIKAHDENGHIYAWAKKDFDNYEIS